MVELLLPLSTAHITQATLDAIETHAIAYPNEYGAFVYVNDEILEPVPQDLKTVFDYANAHSIRWVKFDRDAPELDGLPTYEWEPA